MSGYHSTARIAGDELILSQAQGQVQTFFDELKNGTQNYRTIASLGEQITQEYRGRCILELMQNAHDALANAAPDDPRRISFVLTTSPEPVLLIANSGCPFHTDDFKGICQLGQSPKDPNESVGNKGLGFRSVLEVSTCPEIWSTTPAGSDTAFVFRFDPSVADRVAAAAHTFDQHGLAARSPFDTKRPLVDWSQEQIERYRERLSDEEKEGSHEAENFLSPYQFPLPIEGVLFEVEELLCAGHATVIRLRLDGGRTGTCEEAVRSVKEQLQNLDARSTVFLSHLEELVVDIDGERRILERVVDSEFEFSGCQRTRQQRLVVGCSDPFPDDNTTRKFHVWLRKLGGDDDPEQAEQIRALVKHLPNRWPEVRQVEVGIVVEEATEPKPGVFVIFLPTEMTTGTGAHVNAPFYGSLDRREINFDVNYNKLLLESVLDLCLDVAFGLISEEPGTWQACAVIDLLSSTAAAGGQSWCFLDELRKRAAERDSALENHALVLCHGGWHVPGKARVMPYIADDNLIGAERWREHAGFAVVSSVLDGRQEAVETLLKKLDGSPSPTHSEWRGSIEQVAKEIKACRIDVTWDDFFNSLLAVLPEDMRSEPEPWADDPDPLAPASFLPTQDGRLFSASDSPVLFFQPVQGTDDVVDIVEEVPNSVKHRVAFLHHDIRTREEAPQGRNTAVQKFLDGRFVRTFRREDILRDIVLKALPSLPTPHGGQNAELCSDLFSWTMRLVGEDEPDTLLPLLKSLPIACLGGWYAMRDAVFGPGWQGRRGDLIWSLADELPEDAARLVRDTALLPPEDPRWGVTVEGRNGLFARAGVFDGLPLENSTEACFNMSSSSYELPAEPPAGTPQAAWDDWRNAVREHAKPYFSGWHEYTLSEVQLLPEIHCLESLSPNGRQVLSNLILASIGSWGGWESVEITKNGGYSWSHRVTSPLKYWLTTRAWLNDQSSVEQPLGRRWLVPQSLLRGQRDRYSHLDPLSVDLTRRLDAQPELKTALIQLELNVYPTDDDQTGPELLDALATAWTTNRIPAGRFDILVGQIRDAWRHLALDRGLPKTFLVRKGRRRTFETRGLDELADVYLPDRGDRTRSLQDHEKQILEMHTSDANRTASRLIAATRIRRASSLDESFLIDDEPWTSLVDGIPPLDETRYAWLPITLLTVAAQGGTNPMGATTVAWQQAAERLRRARVLECETIAVQLIDDDQVVASNEPAARWLSGDVLAIRRDVGLSYEVLAPAAQAILDRQDLLKDSRLVLGALADKEEPTPKQIEKALERAEIDSQSLADVRHRWSGNISLILDRIRPVLSLFRIADDGLNAATTDIDHLTEWLSSNLTQWSAQAAISAAQRSRDDSAMGEAAWRAIGDVAQLPVWNKALATLGDGYATVENPRAADQTQAHLDEAMPLLRGLARYIAVDRDNPDLFIKIEAVNQSFKGNDDWSTQWWAVPFEAVIGKLRVDYAKIIGSEFHLEVLNGAKTVDDLRTAFHRKGIGVADPYEIAGMNKMRLDEVLLSTRDLHREWKELGTSNSIAHVPPETPAELDPVAYLGHWSDSELIERALRIIDDEDFINACKGCESLEEIRQVLELTSENIHARRQDRLRRDQEAERRRRTFGVAGAPFEVGTESYSDLFERLNGLADPQGPNVEKDETTPLAEAAERIDDPGEGVRKASRISHLRPSDDLLNLVGVVGEIHAYRFLRAKFGKDVVTRDAWLSENRLQVLPLVKGEPDRTSDSHGFDFQFIHRRIKWYVEVKATAGVDSQFDLGISEIYAATNLARRRGGRWRILRVRNALSDQPEVEWLPNPFEEDYKKHFRLDNSGMRVSYMRKKI